MTYGDNCFYEVSEGTRYIMCSEYVVCKWYGPHGDEFQKKLVWSRVRTS